MMLTPLEAVRKRPAMYIGSTETRGLLHLFEQPLSYSLRETFVGPCNNIDVVIHKDGGLSVSDNGRGLPTDIDPQSRLPIVTLVCTEMQRNPQLIYGTYQQFGVLFGLDFFCVTALSKNMEVVIRRHGKVFRQLFAKGVPLSDLEVIGQSTDYGDRGMRVSFTPDPEIFRSIDWETLGEGLRKKLREQSFLNRGVRFSFTNEIAGSCDDLHKTEIFHSDKGIGSFVELLNREKVTLHEVIHFMRQRDGVIVDIAFQYTDGHKRAIRSYANDIHTRWDGTHVSGFLSGLGKALNPYMKSTYEAWNDPGPLRRRLKRDLTAVISCFLPNPRFEMSTKMRLGNPELEGLVQSITTECLSRYFDSHPAIPTLIIKKAFVD